MSLSVAALLIGIVFVQYINAGTGAPDCPQIISRSRWGARKPEQTDYQTFPVGTVIVSHTATSPCNTRFECAKIARSIQAYHMNDKHFDDIAYSFLIGGNGEVYEGRGWIKTGAHTFGWNSRSVGVAFIGDFTEKPASENQINALRQLLSCGLDEGYLSENYKLFGQLQLQATDSPGLALYQQLQEFASWSEITE